MDVSRVINTAKEIEKCDAALGWLQEHGRNLTNDGVGQFTVQIELNLASSSEGAKEAGDMLASYATIDIEALVSTAIVNCTNTIETHRTTIRSELEA